MSEMIERVARALFDQHTGFASGNLAADLSPTAYLWEGDHRVTDTHRDYWRRQARAAIAAMRKPTEAMISADRMVSDGDGQAWRAMIDAALKE